MTLSHVDELVGPISDLLFVYPNRPGAIFDLEEHLGFPITRTVVTRIVPVPCSPDRGARCYTDTQA